MKFLQSLDFSWSVRVWEWFEDFGMDIACTGSISTNNAVLDGEIGSSNDLGLDGYDFDRGILIA